MGPNVKFVSAITGALSNKKMGFNFFLQKRPNRGGEAKGGLVKDHTFAAFFFTPSLIPWTLFLPPLCSTETHTNCTLAESSTS